MVQIFIAWTIFIMKLVLQIWNFNSLDINSNSQSCSNYEQIYIKCALNNLWKLTVWYFDKMFSVTLKNELLLLVSIYIKLNWIKYAVIVTIYCKPHIRLWLITYVKISLGKQHIWNLRFETAQAISRELRQVIQYHLIFSML